MKQSETAVDRSPDKIDTHRNAAVTPAARIFETLLILILFAAFAGQLPPDVNESHYLTKARHGWDSNWCPNDIFLSSTFSHWLFYVATGWLNSFLSLSQVAWVGRLITWLALAFAWQRLSWKLVPVRGLSLLSAAVFLLLNDRFHLAGEWVVGGFESKGLSYAFVLLALSEIVAARWSRTWMYLGAATAWHVLIGGWAWVAVAFTLMITVWQELQSGRGTTGLWLRLGWQGTTSTSANPSGIDRFSLPIGACLSLIGILPPLLGDRSATAAESAMAASIYVNQRIAHHLAFDAFPALHVARFITMLVVLALACAWLLRHTGQLAKAWRELSCFAVGSLLISLLGLWLSGINQQLGAEAAWSTSLLRFYWFRLADFAVPMATSLCLSLIAYERIRTGNLPLVRIGTTVFVVAMVAAMALVIWDRHDDPRPRADQKALPNYPDQPERTQATYRNWRKVCGWIRTNTPEDAVFITPAAQQTFKWYAQRTEAVNWKDVPQDATSMVEWYERLKRLYEPQRRYAAGLLSYTDDQLRSLAEEYGADYLLVPQWQVDALNTPSDLQQVYPQDPSEKSTYVVFQFADEMDE